jgi:hypothetical protein
MKNIDSTVSSSYERLSQTEITVNQFWSLPDRTRDTVEDMLLFYGECIVWYENAEEYGVESNGYHIVPRGCGMQPLNAADYRLLGRMTRDRLPDMWAHRLGRTTERFAI